MNGEPRTGDGWVRKMRLGWYARWRLWRYLRDEYREAGYGGLYGVSDRGWWGGRKEREEMRRAFGRAWVEKPVAKLDPSEAVTLWRFIDGRTKRGGTMKFDPPLLRPGGLSGRIYVITHGKELEGGIEATRKYDVTDQFKALADGWKPGERQAVLDVINLYGDEVLHKALDDIGFVSREEASRG